MSIRIIAIAINTDDSGAVESIDVVPDVANARESQAALVEAMTVATDQAKAKIALKAGA